MEELLNEAVIVAGFLAVVINQSLKYLVKPYITNTDLLPPIAMVSGILIGLIFGWYLGADLFLYGFAGFMAGIGAVGGHETAEKGTKVIKGEE